jgi:tetratricopeptide (TPR) repeat protein
MSKIMDNLARVQTEQAAEKKPSLFLVRDQAAPSSAGANARSRGRKALAVWGAVVVAVGALTAAHFHRTPPGAGVPNSDRPAPANAVSLIKGRDLEGARRALQGLVAANPGSRVHGINYAYVLKELGRVAEAEAEYRRVLALFPGDSTALNNLGALYIRVNRLTEAEDLLRKPADAGYADAKVNLAAVLEKRKDWAGALRLFEELLAAEAGGASQHQIRERVRRLRSLAVSSAAPKEAF